MRYIRWFEEVRSHDIGLVGGKGANLGEMVAAGLPVPPGFCVTAEAYRDFIEKTGLSREIVSRLADLSIETPDELQEGCAYIRSRILEIPVPPAISDDVLWGYGQLVQRMGRTPEEGVAVAVRSSATAEDLPTASFAGQQETFLNVIGEERVLNRIRDCWASLWTTRAVTYRARQGFDHRRVYLCAVVQAMIPAEISGILFTANPVTGDRDEAVINASWGLGEAVVSGMVTPDTLTVRKSDGRIVSKEIGGKEVTLEQGRDGGTMEVTTPAPRRTVASLEDAQVAKLVSLGGVIEAHYGTPQDIEWGYAAGQFYVLQSRPITTPVGVAEKAGEEDEFNRTMFVELFPDPLSPIFLSVVSPLLKEMLDFNFRIWGFHPPDGIEAIGVHYNQPYFNKRYIDAALRPLPTALRQRLASQVVNPWARHERGLRTEWSVAFARMIVGALRFMFGVPTKMPRLVSAYRQEVEDLGSLALHTTSDEVLASRIRPLVFGNASRLLNFDFALIALLGITYQMLGTLLERYFGDETEELRARLISGVTGNVTMETNKALWDLASVAKSSPSVVNALGAREPEKVRARLNDTPEGRGFLDTLDAFLEEFGHREIRMDILYPTWGEDPAPVLEFVRAYLQADEAQSPHRQQDRLVVQRQELARHAEDRLGRDLRGRLFLLPLFRWVLRRTQALTRERDTMHFELTRFFPIFRRWLLELGRRWTHTGHLSNEDDIFFLTLEESEDVAARPRSMREEVRLRRAEHEASRTRAWPDIIRGGQEIFPRGASELSVTEGALIGIAGSPGLASGTARVIRGPDEFGRLQPGEILVAPLTTPVWTPLFAVAGGVVTEVGGILSHGAIVAREYGIPAVMSVAGVTTIVQDGQELQIDGNRGVIRISGESAS